MACPRWSKGSSLFEAALTSGGDRTRRSSVTTVASKPTVMLAVFVVAADDDGDGAAETEGDDDGEKVVGRAIDSLLLWAGDALAIEGGDEPHAARTGIDRKI